MSGHSKWATIKHRKGAQDAKRGKIFTKIIREITVAARIGGGDPETNPRLRTAILGARAVNMPNDNVERAIKKGVGGLDGVEYQQLIYEGYGPGGVAIMVDTLTDNKNRTAADIRSIFSKRGGNLGESGCVAYLFDKKGLIVYSAAKYEEERILDQALEAGAEDVNTSGESIEVVCEPPDFEALLHGMQQAGFEHTSAAVERIPRTTVTLDGAALQRVLKMIDTLEDHDDVQSISTNVDIPDDLDLN